MIYNRYVFDDDTDYEAVLATTNQMYSDTLTPSGGCCTKQGASILDKVNPILFSIPIDATDLTKYKSDIKSAYLILYTFLS